MKRKWSWVQLDKSATRWGDPLRLTAWSSDPGDCVELYLTVADVMEIVRKLPKLADAWSEVPRVYSKCFQRRDVHGAVVALIDAFPGVQSDSLNCAWIAGAGNSTKGVAPSIQEAKKLADNALRADGWLLEEEQVDE